MTEEYAFYPYISSLPEGKRFSIQQAEDFLLKKLDEGETIQDRVIWDLVKFYSITGRPSKAIRYIQRLLKLAETTEAQAALYLSLGQLLEQLQDYDSAILCYSRALAMEPVNQQIWFLIHNNLGYCLNILGEFEDAEACLREAIRIDPERHNAYKNLGIALEGQGRSLEAVNCYVDAVRANPYDPRALKLMENLLDREKWILAENPSLANRLKACQAVVHAALLKKKKP